MEILLIWGQKFRPWGYEVRVDLQDDSGQIYNVVLNFPVKEKEEIPDKEAVAKAVDVLIERIERGQAMMTAELVQEPFRKAQEAKAEFMMAVSDGRLKKADMVAELQAITTASSVGGKE